MPYTLVHPIFSIWIKKRWLPNLSYTGLVMGSITPDLDILFRFSESNTHILSAKPLDVFLKLLPITILLNCTFHLFLRNEIIKNLPNKLIKHLKKFEDFNYLYQLRKNPLKEIISALIAIYLHFFLDIITHWNAAEFMQLMNTIIYPGESLSYFYFYFGWYFPQIMATCIGLYLYVRYSKQLPFNLKNIIKEIKTMSPKSLLFWINFGVIAIIFGVIKLQITSNSDMIWWHAPIIYGTSGIVFSFFFTPFLFNLFAKVKKGSGR